MATKVVLEMPVRGFQKLVDYLDRHEYDIAAKINDFEELKSLFVAVFEQDPSEQP
jgi:hypothetical protein